MTFHENTVLGGRELCPNSDKSLPGILEPTRWNSILNRGPQLYCNIGGKGGDFLNIDFYAISLKLECGLCHWHFVEAKPAGANRSIQTTTNWR